MIHWLLQSAPITDPVEHFLSAAEKVTYAGFVNTKRQRDWLLGRWTAKHLLQRVIVRSGGAQLSLTALEIHSDSAGAPLVQIPGHSDLSLSISHSHDHALCAVIEAEAWPLGADLEFIEPRTPRFFWDYFSPEERRLVEMAAPDQRDMLVTAIWSAKEAALKALHIGLSVDTRAVTCLIQPPQHERANWSPFEVFTDNRQLKREAPPLTGWWRIEDDFVLTLVCRPNDAHRS